ncbi:hypothetical protein OVA14_04075 [Agrococcus sp. SL85]|uniref:hypothetical protein n=1 Tax=Agrococcus sp. SL85 TaxID=2995141 RepID=UPI00226CD2C8|nr:hypothetical protein [Agrococcus sp. SL85]WAC66951.1 hypothetical protein OVA14_04075 [Agrococcus sp. SL85]
MNPGPPFGGRGFGIGPTLLELAQPLLLLLLLAAVIVVGALALRSLRAIERAVGARPQRVVAEPVAPPLQAATQVVPAAAVPPRQPPTDPHASA